MANPDDPDDDALLRRLYDEPDSDDASGEVAKLRRLRGAFQAYAQATDEEPPSRGLDELMAAARARVATRPAVAVETAPLSFWVRLKKWFSVSLAHPALASATVVIVVASIAGVLYVRGKTSVEDRTTARPTSITTEQRAAAPPSGSAGVADPHAGVENAPVLRYADEAEGDRDGVAPAAPAPAETARPEPPADPKPERKRKPAVATKETKADKPLRGFPVKTESGKAAADGESSRAPVVGGGGGAGGEDQLEENKPTSTTPPAQAATSGAAPPEPAATADAPGRQATPAKPTPTKPTSKTTKAPPAKPPDVAQLTNQARNAAKAGDCVLVNNLGVRVRSVDARYYARNFAPDAQIKRCSAPANADRATSTTK